MACSGCFTPGKETQYPLYRGWVGFRARMDWYTKSCPHRCSNSDHPDHSNLLYQLCYSSHHVHLVSTTIKSHLSGFHNSEECSRRVLQNVCNSAQPHNVISKKGQTGNSADKPLCTETSFHPADQHNN